MKKFVPVIWLLALFALSTCKGLPIGKQKFKAFYQNLRSPAKNAAKIHLAAATLEDIVGPLPNKAVESEELTEEEIRHKIQNVFDLLNLKEGTNNKVEESEIRQASDLKSQGLGVRSQKSEEKDVKDDEIAVPAKNMQLDELNRLLEDDQSNVDDGVTKKKEMMTDDAIEDVDENDYVPENDNDKDDDFTLYDDDWVLDYAYIRMLQDRDDAWYDDDENDDVQDDVNFRNSYDGDDDDVQDDVNFRNNYDDDDDDALDDVNLWNNHPERVPKYIYDELALDKRAHQRQ